MKIAVIQIAVEIGNIAYNEAHAIDFILEAAKHGSDLIVLPELWNSGYDLEHLSQFAAPVKENSSLQKMQKLSAELGIYLVAGSVATKENNRYYNTAAVIDKKGTIIGAYHKAHLFPLGLKEDQYFDGGEHFCLIDTPWARVGVLLCYDIRFPAFCQNLILQGADILVVPAQFPQARIEHWQILNQARAIENQCFVAAANVTGKADSGYCGCSMLISPWGEILAQADAKEQIIYGEFDLSSIQKVRKTIPVFQQRKNILDEIRDK